MHLAYLRPISINYDRFVHEGGVTNNVRGYANSFRFLVAMKAWRDVLLNVSHEHLWTSLEKPKAYRSSLCSFFFWRSIGIELKCWNARFL